VHDAAGAPSSEHRNVTPDSVSLNARLALSACVDAGGFEVIDGTGGGVVSTVQVPTAGVASMFPAASTAFTCIVCVPESGPGMSYEFGHGANDEPSSLHLNVVCCSFEPNVNSNGPVEAVVPEGPERIVVSGGVVSTVHVRWMGGPGVPAAVPRTVNVWEPSARPVYWRFDAQEVIGAPSSEHWYVVFCMSDDHLNVADVEVVDEPSAGPEVIVTVGPELLTLHENWAGDDGLPAGSVATIENACEPFPRLG